MSLSGHATHGAFDLHLLSPFPFFDLPCTHNSSNSSNLARSSPTYALNPQGPFLGHRLYHIVWCKSSEMLLWSTQMLVPNVQLVITRALLWYGFCLLITDLRAQVLGLIKSLLLAHFLLFLRSSLEFLLISIATWDLIDSPLDFIKHLHVLSPPDRCKKLDLYKISTFSSPGRSLLGVMRVSFMFDYIWSDIGRS